MDPETGRGIEAEKPTLVMRKSAEDHKKALIEWYARHYGSFTARVALEAVREDRTVEEIAVAYRGPSAPDQ